MNIGELIGKLIPLDDKKQIIIELMEDYHERSDLIVVDADETDDNIVLKVQ